MRGNAVVVFVAGLLAGVPSAQQQPAPSASEPPPAIFRAEVNYVEVDALVTGQQGNVVTDLTQDDFEIRENGNQQTISSFSLVNIPIEKPERPLFDGKPIEPDVQTNERLDGRIYLIVLDDLHTAPSNAPRVKAALHRFIEQHFGSSDLAAVVFTGGRTIDAQDFTNNVRLLLAAIDRFTGQKLPSATLERIRNASPVGRGSPRSVPGKDDEAEERARRARSAMATIHRLAEFIGNVRGRRKAMLLISEGVEYDMSDLVGTDPRLSGPSGNPLQSAPAQVLERRATPSRRRRAAT
jgi:VWFA-related protein